MVAGRKPKATAVKEASGALRKNPQRRNKAEPKPKRGHPAMPPTVKADKVAASQWNDLCQLLDDMKILTVADQAVMAMYCTTYAEWLKVYEHVRDNGCSYVSVNGNPATSPQTHQYNKLSDRLLKLFAELGLTPSSRSRIKATEIDDSDNPFADLLSRFSGIN